jgi:WD40 repeat protein
VTTRRTVAVLRGHTGWVDAAAFGPDKTTVATASTDGTVRLWCVRTGRT